MTDRETEERPGERATGRITLSGDHVWPIGITIALLIVIAVNVTFIVVAVRGQDDVVPSYVQGER